MRAIILSLVLIAGTPAITAQKADPVQLSVDFSEAEQALHILHKYQTKEEITEKDWQDLFATVPYRWLQAREAGIGFPLSDEQFKVFLLSRDALSRQTEWEQTLSDMKQSDLNQLGTSVLAWLPKGATIHARVFPEIKPKHNSFVWKHGQDGPAIFLYLERQSKDKFENTVAHECHHIGLDSLEEQQDRIQAALPENVKTAMRWMSAFGEGEAMLAAAGSTERHPHWEDDALARARWDGDLMRFNTDVGAIQQLLTDILDGSLKGDDAIRKRAAPFWGDVQGPWYTVGYEMAVLVEKAYGRETLNQCLLDPRKLLFLYNKVASEANAKGATLTIWSPDLLNRLGS